MLDLYSDESDFSTLDYACPVAVSSRPDGICKLSLLKQIMDTHSFSILKRLRLLAIASK